MCWRQQCQKVCYRYQPRWPVDQLGFDHPNVKANRVILMALMHPSRQEIVFGHRSWNQWAAWKSAPDLGRRHHAISISFRSGIRQLGLLVDFSPWECQQEVQCTSLKESYWVLGCYLNGQRKDHRLIARCQLRHWYSRYTMRTTGDDADNSHCANDMELVWPSENTLQDSVMMIWTDQKGRKHDQSHPVLAKSPYWE